MTISACSHGDILEFRYLVKNYLYLFAMPMSFSRLISYLLVFRWISCFFWIFISYLISLSEILKDYSPLLLADELGVRKLLRVNYFDLCSVSMEQRPLFFRRQDFLFSRKAFLELLLSWKACSSMEQEPSFQDSHSLSVSDSGALFRQTASLVRLCSSTFLLKASEVSEQKGLEAQKELLGFSLVMKLNILCRWEVLVFICVVLMRGRSSMSFLPLSQSLKLPSSQRSVKYLTFCLLCSWGSVLMRSRFLSLALRVMMGSSARIAASFIIIDQIIKAGGERGRGAGQQVVQARCNQSWPLITQINNVLILMRKGLTVKSTAQEFKNAFHFSLGGDEPARRVTLEFSPSKSSNKEGFIYSNPKHFGLSHLGKHFKELEHSPSKSKSSLEGLGITIEDNGYFVVGQWRNNQIDGRYFLFHPNFSEEKGASGWSSAMCQYGYMKQGSLQGENYIYSNSGTIAKSSFEQNKIRGKTFIVHNNKMFLASQQPPQQKIECEIIDFTEGVVENQGTLNGSSSILKIPKITQINKDKSNNTHDGRASSNLQQINSRQFQNPQQFLQNLVKSHSYRDKEHYLGMISRNEKQYFIGFLQSQPSNARREAGREPDLTGFGVTFRHFWPLSYGFYKQGKLQGLGRINQTQMTVYDGFFSAGQLLEGFVIDYYANSLAFGHHSSINNEYQSENHSQDCFIITNTFESILLDYVAEYKKNFHLKSLTFNNSYFNAPKIVYRSPWPYNVLNKLQKRKQIEGLLNSFRPTLKDFQISSIQRQGLSSENRVEKSLLRDINQPSVVSKHSLREKGAQEKSKYIKQQINKSLKEHEQKQESYVKSKAIDRYVDEYNRIQRSKTELQGISKQAKLNRNEPEQNQIQSHRYDKSISSQANSKLREQRQVTPSRSNRGADVRAHRQSREKGERPELDLTQLVNEYHLCQTERKKTLPGSISNRLNSERKVSPREVRSKRELMREDHKDYSPRPQEATSRRHQPRRRVNLDQIYHKYLQK